MAVASIQPAATVFREEQNFDWRVYAALMLAEAVVMLGLVSLRQAGHDVFDLPGRRGLVAAFVAASSLAAPLLLAVGFLRMTTEVTPTDVRVWFGWLPTYRRWVGVGQIRKIEVVTYRPLRDHYGWGIRSGPDGERALTARGNRGVRLELSDGSRLLIGSQRPEALAVAIENALRPGV